MSQGWIKLHRNLISWEWYDDANCLRLLIHLLISVNYEPKKWRGIVVNPGELVTSYDNLGKDLRLSKQQVRSALAKLEQSGEITRRRTLHCLHISLLKWDKMQSEKHEKNTRYNPTATRQQPDSNPRITPTKESKEIKEGEEVKKEEVIMPFDSVEFSRVWNDWKDYKKEQHRFRYKSAKSEQTALNKLQNDSGGDEMTAIAIIHESMGNSWQGLFPLKKLLNQKQTGSAAHGDLLQKIKNRVQHGGNS